MPPDVRQLVRDHGLQLLRRQPAQHRRRHQQDGLEPSHHHGHRHARGLEQRNGARQLEPGRESRQHVLPAAGQRARAVSHQAPRLPPAARKPDRADEHAEAPGQDQPGQPAGGVDDDAPRIHPARQPGGLPRGCVGRRSRVAGHHRATRRRRQKRRGGRRGVGEPPCGCNRHQQHRAQRGAAGQVSHAGHAAWDQQPGQAQQEGQRGALPHEVDEAPADHVRHPRQPHRQVGHFVPPSRWSSRRRISARSRADVLRPDSARITSCIAEPPKARSIRSSSS